MILYKYYGFESGISALKSSCLGFRNPEYLNDPFELTNWSNAHGSDSDLEFLEERITELKKHVCILSLTRTALNPLMWSHYGEEHAGFVVGYDVGDDFLTSNEYNLVTVNQGVVDYSSTKNLHLIDEESKKLLHDVFLASQGMKLGIDRMAELENLARKIFLTKNSAWFYEEEVRVVKALDSIFELPEEYGQDPKRVCTPLSKFVAPGRSIPIINGLSIFNYKVKIKEVYFGARNPLLKTNDKIDEENFDYDNSIFDKSESEVWEIYSLGISNKSWELTRHDRSSNFLRLPKKTKGLNNSLSFNGKEAKYLRDKLGKLDIKDGDEFEMTNYGGDNYLIKNGEFE